MAQGPAEIVFVNSSCLTSFLDLLTFKFSHGPILVGTTLNVLLYGVTIVQLYLYRTESGQRYVHFHFTKRPTVNNTPLRDHALIKAFVSS
jgi:ABC-type uncharacterized transport system permease subunit